MEQPQRIRKTPSISMVAAIVALIVGAIVYTTYLTPRGERTSGAGVPPGTVYLPVYGPDKQAIDVEINFYVGVDAGMSLQGKLNVLADRLSRFRFQDDPIEVLRIEQRGGRRIAVVNLEEPDWPDAYTWRSGFFQGSAGGRFTTITLRDTFLQPDYAGDWIDGVEFYYQGEPMGEWDHVNLSGTLYRNDVPDTQ